MGKGWGVSRGIDEVGVFGGEAKGPGCGISVRSRVGWADSEAKAGVGGLRDLGRLQMWSRGTRVIVVHGRTSITVGCNGRLHVARERDERAKI